MNRLDQGPLASDCPRTEELESYFRGRLSGQEHVRINRHLAACGACRSTVDLLHLKKGAPAAADATVSAARQKLLQAGCIGQYQLLEPIGGGGMGLVYKARHARLQQVVALKMLAPDTLIDAEAIARFQREMAALGDLLHPNVVRATDAGEFEGWPYLVMEYVEGMDLSRLVKAQGPLSVADACEAVRQASLGLQCIHEHQRVHRDLKPSNLCVSKEGQVKILDLGLALLCETADDELTGTDQVLGTADFMAPEQARDPHHVDIRADLYSLGCTLFKLLTAAAPYGHFGKSRRDKLRAHAEEPIPAVRHFRPDVPAALEALVQRLLAKDPADRLARPADLAAALAPFAVGSDLARLVAQAHQAPAAPAQAAVPDLEVRETVPFTPAAKTAPQDGFASPRASALSKLPSRCRLALLAALLLVPAIVLSYFLVRPLLVHPPAHNGEPPPAPLAWPANFPERLKERPWNQPLKLIARNKARPFDAADPAQGKSFISGPGVDGLTYQPAWCRRLLGPGLHYERQDAWALRSHIQTQHGVCTLLALDDDVRRRWFQLDADLKEPDATGNLNLSGIFFGWREVAPGNARAYVAFLENASPLAKKQPRLHVAPIELRWTENGQAVPLRIVPLVPLPPGQVLVQDLPRAGPKYHLRLRALPGKITVQIDDRKEMEWQPTLDPRGALGVWAQEGAGRFGEITIQALDPGGS